MKKPLTFWNSINIISLWNSKSEVIKCLHGQGVPKARIQSQMILRSGLTPKPQRDLTSIARLIILQGRRQFDKEYTCFWRKNKNIGSLLYLGGRTVNRYAPDPCGSGVNTLLHPPQKVNYDFFDRGIFMPDLRRENALISHLVKHERTLQQPKRYRFSELWWTRHHRLSGMGNGLSHF